MLPKNDSQHNLAILNDHAIRRTFSQYMNEFAIVVVECNFLMLVSIFVRFMFWYIFIIWTDLGSTK